MDLFSALKNAVERGESLQQAKLTLVSSGYSQQEVEDAAMALQFPERLTAMSMPMPEKIIVKETGFPIPTQLKSKEPEIPVPVPKKSGIPMWVIILLIALLGIVWLVIFVLLKLKK